MRHNKYQTKSDWKCIYYCLMQVVIFRYVAILAVSIYHGYADLWNIIMLNRW